MRWQCDPVSELPHGAGVRPQGQGRRGGHHARAGVLHGAGGQRAINARGVGGDEEAWEGVESNDAAAGQSACSVKVLLFFTHFFPLILRLFQRAGRK